MHNAKEPHMMQLEHTSQHLLAFIKTTAACDKRNDVQVLSHSMTNIQLPSYLVHRLLRWFTGLAV